MTDQNIVERLRDPEFFARTGRREELLAAAAEIERLRADYVELEHDAHRDYQALEAELGKANAEIETLRNNDYVLKQHLSAAAEIEKLTYLDGVNRDQAAEISRLNAEIEKLQARRSTRDPMIAAIASLAAAISLLERTPKAKKAAPSDKMFDQMIADYRKALSDARDAFAISHPQREEPKPVDMRQIFSDGDNTHRWPGKR